MSAEVRIEHWRLRIPGLTEPEARRLGAEVARRVAERLPLEGRTERLGRLDLRLSIPAGVPKDRLASKIAEELLKKLS